MVHVIFLIALFCMIPDLNRRYPFRYFSLIILFLFLALRYDYGNDYMSYFYNHALMNAGSYVWGANDFLFRILNVSIPNFFVLIAVISLFYMISIWHLIKNNLRINQYWFAILILLINPYLFLVHLSSLRQTLAICIFIFAIDFAAKRKLMPYMVLMLAAIGMHSSAVILLPLYFLLTEKSFNKKWVFSTFTLLIILIVTPLLDVIASKLLDYLPRHYSYYYEQGAQNSIRATLISSVYFLFVAANIGKLKGKEIIYGKLSLIATFISIIAIKVSMVTRIGMYFDIFLIISIPQIFNRIERKLYRQILFVILISIYLLRYYSFFTNPLWESFIEYKTILGR